MRRAGLLAAPPLAVLPLAVLSLAVLPLAVLLLAAPAPAAQVADSLAAPSAQPDTTQTPGRALRRALVLPGWGQVYVGQPVKAPVAAAAVGGSIAYLVIQQRRTTRLRRAALYAGCLDAPDRDVCLETDLDALLPAYLASDGETVGAAALRSRRDAARGSRDVAVVVTGAVYALQALDAYVSAHLLSFDVSDDLSVGVEPGPGGTALRLRVAL